ncbi:hypothetical protein WJX84_006594 [Apatococcus fuscideae]|uniref:ATPase AAA-type core domain-containing protein n=1 Tax=Apatococcus fuscideae TaxID=2026836 RepID=A0AAW1T8P5_9CHLO
MQLHFSHFVKAPCSQEVADQLNHLPSFPGSQYCCLSGPSRSGRTTALLQLASSFLGEGFSVLFVCRQDLLEQAAACFPEHYLNSQHNLASLPVRYLATFADLRKLAACLHLLPQRLDALLIDDFGAFAGESQHDRRPQDSSEMMRTLAHLHEAVRQQGQDCHLILAGNQAEKTGHLIQRWMPIMISLQVTGWSTARLTALVCAPYTLWTQHTCRCLEMRSRVDSSLAGLDASEAGWEA